MIFRLFVYCALLSVLISLKAFAACSPHVGNATLNEIMKAGGNNGDVFIEFKLLNTSILAATYNQWTLRMCHDEGKGNKKSSQCKNIPVSQMNDATQWIWVEQPTVDRDFIDFKDGFYLALLDEKDDFIDYIQIDGYSAQNFSASCGFNNLQHVFNIPNTITNGTKILLRKPDGTGEWFESKNLNEFPPTPSSSNDGDSVVTPIANYRFDESSWSGVAGEVIDETGNFPGQAIGGLSTENTTSARTGNPGTCRYGSFDGANDYIEVADDPALDLLTELTITAWIRPDSIPSSGLKTIVSKDENYEFHLNSSGEIFWWWQTHSFATTGAGITPGNWYHIAITYKSGQQSIYVNGVEKGSRNYTGNLPLNNDPLQIGQDLNFTSRSFHGSIDEVSIYTNALNKTAINTIYQETHPCAISIIDHFEINHDGQGLTCEPESITIKACADASCSILNNDLADVQLSINGAFDKTVTVAGGSTTTNFSYVNANTATLSLDQTYECKNGASASCDVLFAEAGFILDINGNNDVESCDKAKSLLIKAVKLSDDGVSCAPAFVGDQPLNLEFNYQNPVAGTKVPLLVGSAMAASGVSQNRVITFNGDGEATLPIQYDDAGELSFSVSEIISSGVSLATLTKAFYPAELVVSTALTSTDSDGTVKQIAGVDFPISVIAQCQKGTATENYAPQTNTILQLSAQQKEPIANTGVLKIGSVNIVATNLATTTWVSANQTAVNFNGKYSEVGIINLAAQDTNYFGNTINSAGYNTAGRFIPDHFEQTVVESGDLDSVCNQNTAFAYIGQALVDEVNKGAISYLVNPVVELTAKNVQGGVTKNYTEAGYNKLVAAADFIVQPTVDSTIKGKDTNFLPLTANIFAGTVSHNGLVVGEASFGVPLDAGVLHYELSDADNFVYPRNENSEVNAQDNDINFLIDQLNFVDSDGVGINSPVDITSTTGVNIRFGRAYLENSFGPETANLPQPFSTQYLNASGSYVVNDQDSCTNYDASNILLTSGTLNKASTGVSTAIGQLDSGETRAMFLTAPGAGNQGTINVEYNIYDWLQYDWSWNGVDAKVFNENPSAKATFGLFRGNDRIIYQREVH